MSGHQGPAITLLRRAYNNFKLDTTFRLSGTLRLLMDYEAPLGPNTPSSDASLHPLMGSRHLALELAPSRWSLFRQDNLGASQSLASGELKEQAKRSLRAERQDDSLKIELDGHEIWAGLLPAAHHSASSGVLGLRLAEQSHVAVDWFRLRGTPKPARIVYLWTDALLGAGESPADWDQKQSASFRYGTGVISKAPGARVKWNVIGRTFSVWCPRGPGYGTVEVRLDGKVSATLNLHAETETASQSVWQVSDLADTFHTVVLVGKSGNIPVDCLEVTAGP
jgi:hypothetical protein